MRAQMAFDRPSMVEVERKDLARLNGLVDRLENELDDPYLDEMRSILRRILHLDEKRHEPED
jgi:hypothetical protein